MNDELTKITLTFPMRCNTPNCNGTVFTEEAIRNAFASSNSHMPIIMQDKTIQDKELTYQNDSIIGYTDSTYHFDYDDENKVCKVTLDGKLFNMTPNIIINEMKNGKITNFEIRSINILK